MNFFEHQQVARRKTHAMVLFFLLAVIGVIVAMDIFIAVLYVLFDYWMDPSPEADFLKLIGMLNSIPTPVYMWGAIITFALILVESIRQTFKLRAGGEAIAAAFGARHILPSTSDLLERRLLNVVEEMAIASGIRVPAVYILDNEEGINAFAAGFNVSNSIIAVTRGMLDTLSRDELQGVIGHEFSHILNGDMSLNIRMMGVLSGIVVIGSIGLYVIRAAFEADDFKAGITIFLAGTVICIIGFSGLFFARLIKAAVSREREFLADASSVQFTRNPDGIAGALDQIRAAGRDTLIHHRYAEEVSHMFFGQSIKVWFGGLFDTHPPIDKRIQRVNPGFQPNNYRKRRPAQTTETADAQTPADADGETNIAGRLLQSVAPVDVASFASGAATGYAGTRGSDASEAWTRSSTESAALVGTLNAGKVDTAQRLLAALPAGMRERLRDPEGARAAIIALMLAPKDDVMQEQLAAAHTAGAGQLAAAASEVAKVMQDLGPAFHLPVIDLALPAIKSASADAKQELLKALEAVIHADRRVSLHEFVVLTLVRSQLEPQPAYAEIKFKSLTEVRPEILLLLSLVAHAGCKSGSEGKQDFHAAFSAGVKVTGFTDAPPIDRDALDLESAAAALAKLRGLAPLKKAVLIKALFAAITADGTIRIIEAELMRMVGAALDCPLPQLSDNFDPATLAA